MPEPMPKLVIVVVDDAVPCGCAASASLVSNQAVRMCATGGGTCFKLENISQPTLTNGKCSSLPGSPPCTDESAPCRLQFTVDVTYVQDCCGCGGADLQVAWDNGVWGLTQDTVSEGGSQSYSVDGTVACSNPAAAAKNFGISASCGGGTVQAVLKLTCAACSR